MVKRAEGALLQSIALDRAGPPGLSIQISARLRDLILGGALASGARLPASRTLARELGVARTTIVEAFERLVAEGLLETRVGSGTFVSGASMIERPAAPALETPEPSAAGARLANLVAAAAGRFGQRLGHEPRPFTTAMPSLDDFPMAQWSRLSAKHWRGARQQVLGYPDPLGYKPLRQAIASHLQTHRGVACDWRHVFIVAGAQQAFQIIAGTLIDPGDKVWFENPGAIGARNTLLLQGADLVPVPVDEGGMNVDVALARAPHFKLAFVTPAHQQPLGAKLSLDRRFALLRAAEAAGAWIVEDDWDGEFCLSGPQLPTLRGIDPTGRVIYVGTFSKSLFPSLRLGFLLAPPGLAEHMRSALQAFSPGVPTPLQAVVADFISEGHFATHVRRMRRLYAERYEALRDGVSRKLSDWLDLVPTTTGLHTVAFLRCGLEPAKIAAAAAARGVTVAPVDRFCIEPIDRAGLVLGFSGFRPAQIAAGIDLLADVFARMTAEDAARSGLAPAPEWT